MMHNEHYYAYESTCCLLSHLCYAKRIIQHEEEKSLLSTDSEEDQWAEIIKSLKGIKPISVSSCLYVKNIMSDMGKYAFLFGYGRCLLSFYLSKGTNKGKMATLTLV